MECRILLASLTAHTNGMIDGEWIDLTDNNAKDEIKAFMDEREGHEFFIADNVASVPMDIDENDDPYKLVDFMKRLEDLDEIQLEAYETIMNESGWYRKEALDTVENWEFDAIEWKDGSIEKAVGYYYAELGGYLDTDDTIRKYFDYEKYGRDICDERYVWDNGRTIFVIYC